MNWLRYFGGVGSTLTSWLGLAARRYMIAQSIPLTRAGWNAYVSGLSAAQLLPLMKALLKYMVMFEGEALSPDDQTQDL